MRTSLLLLAAAVAVSACSTRQVDPVPVGIENDQVLPDASATVAQARARADAARQQAQSERDAAMTEALGTCSGAVCDALGRGQVSLGMNEAQVMAVTGSTQDSWRRRGDAAVTVMAAANSEQLPSDAVGAVSLVQLQDGRVTSYTYQTPQGPRVVRTAQDATADGAARAQADLLIREGDTFAAAGDLDRALDRYDRASVLVQDPMVEYKIATVLDKSLRPVEALMRYQRFIHEMEIERIEARGRAAGELANAIAHARERVLIIERNR